MELSSKLADNCNAVATKRITIAIPKKQIVTYFRSNTWATKKRTALNLGVDHENPERRRVGTAS
eukprot:4136461-Amphidinium_carterae.1